MLFNFEQLRKAPDEMVVTVHWRLVNLYSYLTVEGIFKFSGILDE
jgi:hypothetical protein